MHFLTQATSIVATCLSKDSSPPFLCLHLAECNYCSPMTHSSACAVDDGNDYSDNDDDDSDGDEY